MSDGIVCFVLGSRRGECRHTPEGHFCSLHLVTDYNLTTNSLHERNLRRSKAGCVTSSSKNTVKCSVSVLYLAHLGRSAKTAFTR